MRKFTLRLEEDGPGEPRTVEFEGVDPSAVFYILQREVSARRASLWEGERSLGRLTRERPDLWQIG